MTFPRLYAIVDADASRDAGWHPADLAGAYLAGGARLLQIRAKNFGSGGFLELVESVVELARPVDAHVIVNDRADVAVLAGAAGVHVGQDDLAPADVRRVTGPDSIVGLSTHTSHQIEDALAQPISYLAIGPVFSTLTKATGYEAVGYKTVQQAAARAVSRGLPVVAIGGITLETAPRVIEAGAASVAVITDLLTADPAARVKQYLAALG